MSFKNGFISVISFVLFLGIIFSPVSLKTNQLAYADDETLPTTIEKDKMLSVLDVIQNGIVEENDKTKLNLDYAKEIGLSNTEINNLQQALIETSSDDLKEIESESELLEKEILKKDDVIQIDELTASARGRHAAPPSALERTLKLVFGAIAGVTLANLIVTDLYKLGAYSACHKWGKTRPKVKGACKTLGYW
ncbi:MULTISPECIES: hypothetical protein [Peribacillus]|uniref:hypothetical protein n=1 Tax=Peribacillus TaxID=2675229 RepID=UPI001F4E113E|nr:MULTISPECIES: hypothetical protein [unclassified Peribacillus]MCK1983195.1 hypothetical protein [Peribacillus sp. Aquil_B1]MCK2006212.1 hypothetical protein [Peribacillus sp. Aquil_B8]